MQGTKRKWYRSDGLWAYYINDIWTGLVIIDLTGQWAIPYKPITYHIRDYQQHKDISDAHTLKEAKKITKHYYGSMKNLK
jgi:hypothetical protein